MPRARTASLLLVLVTLTGCGAGGGDADDVPTITTQPSPRTAPTQSGAPSSGTDSPTSSSATAETSATPTTQTSAPSPTGSSIAPPTTAPPPDRLRGPTNYDAAIDRINAVASRGTTVFESRFFTPGDVLYCLLADPVIGPSCELGNGFIHDPEVCGPDSTDRVGRIETFQGEVRAVCNADTIREAGAPEVEPPAAVVAGDVTCGVEQFGVTCIDRVAGMGFFLGKGEYHVFPRPN